MIGAFRFLRPLNIRCYFITGTGRCGTMLVSKLLSLGRNTQCDHEKSIIYTKIKQAYLTGEMEPLHEEIGTVIEPLVKSHNRKGMIYGECSGLMYLVFEELYRRYGKRARFVLLVRHPEEFVRSALARGFFDPQHPHALEHLRARPDTDMGKRWETASPFEKCLWYWNLVNGMLYNFFCCLPDNLWKIQQIEKLDVESSRELFEFLQVDGFNEKDVQEMLSVRINATPVAGHEGDVNPWSSSVNLGSRSSWDQTKLSAYEKWAKPLSEIFYPEG
jgi:hypothetical protein